MAGYGKTIRSLGAGLAGFLLTLVAWAQDGSAVGVGGVGDQPVMIDVKGVLISPRSRSALINGQVLRVGDQIGTIEIVAIDHREVRLRTGSREAGVSIGISTSTENLYWSPAAPALIEPAEPQVAAVMEVPAESIPVTTVPRHHAVSPGETLSEIAEAYLLPGVRRHQLMVALFEANPHAFRGNINAMRAGVVLDIPDMDSLTKVPPKTAMAKVIEHTDRWRSEHPRRQQNARPAVAETYGPVSSGETLSLIAYRLLPDGGNAGALMSALYDANPHAFGDSMNMLREGAVLRIPDQVDRDSPPTETHTIVAHLSPQ